MKLWDWLTERMPDEDDELARKLIDDMDNAVSTRNYVLASEIKNCLRLIEKKKLTVVYRLQHRRPLRWLKYLNLRAYL